MSKIRATPGELEQNPAPPMADTFRREQHSAGSGLPRRRFLNDMPDKGQFGFVAVFGFVIIVTLKLYNYNSDAVAGLAVALMLAYGLIAYRIPSVHIRLDRFGGQFLLPWLYFYARQPVRGAYPNKDGS